MINGTSQLESINNATELMRVQAKKTVLRHDPEGHDIVEMLGLGEVK